MFLIKQLFQVIPFSYSLVSDEGLALEMSAFESLYGTWPIYLINSVDKTKFSYSNKGLLPFLRSSQIKEQIVLTEEYTCTHCAASRFCSSAFLLFLSFFFSLFFWAALNDVFCFSLDFKSSS